MEVGVGIIIMTMIMWWRDVIREGTYEGSHTRDVEKGIKVGMILFISSEVLFFFSFFWALFHSSLGPVIEIGLN
jgi:cytochrome c oxidase subunit 3